MVAACWTSLDNTRLTFIISWSSQLLWKTGRETSRVTPFRCSHFPIASQTRHPESLHSGVCGPRRGMGTYVPSSGGTHKSTPRRVLWCLRAPRREQGTGVWWWGRGRSCLLLLVPHFLMSNGRRYCPDLLPGWGWGSKRSCEWMWLVKRQGHPEVGDNCSWLGGNTYSGNMKEHFPWWEVAPVRRWEPRDCVGAWEEVGTQGGGCTLSGGQEGCNSERRRIPREAIWTEWGGETLARLITWFEPYRGLMTKFRGGGKRQLVQFFNLDKKWQHVLNPQCSAHGEVF